MREISAHKNEPKWMLDLRLKAFKIYQKLPMPKFGPDLSKLDLSSINYFQRATDQVARDWEDVPDSMKQTFEKLGVPEAERKYLAGAEAQYESEAVYASLKQEYAKLGIIFFAIRTLHYKNIQSLLKNTLVN